jgi:YfiH family protein
VIRKEANGIEWLEFELFQGLPLQHAVFLRKGGVSTGPFASLNLGRYAGDEEKHIEENQKRVAACFDFLPITYVEQVHKDAVVEIVKEGEKIIADALITNKRSLPLAMTHADCQVAIFYDARNHALAVVHAGWRGNVLNIYEKTLAKMEQLYGSKREELLVVISPSLGPNAAEFIHYKEEFPPSFWKFQIRHNYFDLWVIAENQLQQSGVPLEHIQIARQCTFENPSDFFSYRREKKSGRHATIASLL